MELSISERMYILKTLPNKSIQKLSEKLEITTDEFWQLLRFENDLPPEMTLLCKQTIKRHKKSKKDLDNDLFK